MRYTDTDQLLQKNADANLVDKFNSTVLTSAAQDGDTESMKLFLNIGVCIDERNYRGRTSLMLTAAV